MDPSTDSALAPAAAPPRRLAYGYELALVVVVATALLLPGIWRYSLVDPWETHYGEVARRMLADHDWVHTDWQNEGFRSKPVLTFWLMATSMRALGHGADGGFSGEMTSSPTVVMAIRLPFVLLAVMGLTLTWLMLARLVNRRAAWLALLTVGTCPFFFMIARQGITDMTLVSMLLGAFSMFLLASEDGATPIRPWARLLRVGPRFQLTIDLRWVAALVVGGFLLTQAFYYLWYFQVARFNIALKALPFRQPGLALCIPMVLAVAYVLEPRAFAAVRAVFIFPVLVAQGRRDAWAEAWRLAQPSVFAYPLAAALYPTVPAGADRFDAALTRARRYTDVAPLTRTGSVYMIFFWTFIGVSVLGKGIPGFGLAGVCCALFVVFQNRWRHLHDGGFEVKRGIVLLLAIVLPWHLAMWMRDGQLFITEWIFTHNLNRAAAGVHGDRGTFDYCLSQVGYGMMLWGALAPVALVSAALTPARSVTAGRARFMIACWAVAATTLFSLSQTKFNHYIFPAVPPLAILVALWLDDLLDGRVKPSWVLGGFVAGVALLLARDMMHEEKQWIEMYIYRHDRPWPSAPPYGIDASDGFLVIGLAGAAAGLLIGTRARKLAVVALGAVSLGTALWAMHVYMPIAGTHWGMRDAVARYYRERTIYGQKLVYATPRQFADDWAAVARTGAPHWDFDTVIPDNFGDGQPMKVTIEVQGLKGGDSKDAAMIARGTARAIGPHTLRIEFAAGEVAPIVDAARRHAKDRPAPCAPRPRPGKVACPYRLVDADRLIAWQLYWRGENFWSGNEIWGPVPEMKTAMKETDNAAFLQYLKDPNLAPEGRTYYIITESGRTGTLKTLLPTQTARDTVQVIDTTSNKFSLARFQL